MKVDWQGVFPAVTTQFDEAFAIDHKATRKVIENLVRDGADGLIVCGTVGEGTSLSAEEKRAVLKTAVEVAGKRVPVLAGVAEYTTDLACRLAKDAETVGCDGLMVLPAMVYSAKPRETLAHFRTVAGASGLPVMLYNNPPVYKVDITPPMVASLADAPTVVSMKESSGDTRRYTDIRNLVGDRFVLFCGLDDVVVESVMLGCVGWVSGMSNVFPAEGARLLSLARAGRWAEARKLYDWFMPLLHLDARPDLVQCIKLCEQIAGRGSERTRLPRLALEGADRAEVERLMREALASRPALAKVA